MKFSIKDFVSKSNQIRSFLWIWSHLLKKSLMENFIFCGVDERLNDLRDYLYIYLNIHIYLLTYISYIAGNCSGVSIVYFNNGFSQIICIAFFNFNLMVKRKSQ